MIWCLSPKYRVHNVMVYCKSETFFDLATQKRVYKTDEEVEVINEITCGPEEFVTADY